jgi:dolichol-phosphate mannosyltransferase
MQPTLTVIIPALNEATNLEKSVALLDWAASPRFSDYELLIFNDGSQDNTGEIADRIAKQNPHVRVIHNPQNMGIAYSFCKGVECATMDYVGVMPGDTNTAVSPEDVEVLFDGVGKADIALEYVISDARPWHKRWISQGFVIGMNILFGLNIKYYNGSNFCRRELVQQVEKNAEGYGIFSEVLIRLLKSGCTFVEVGISNQDTEGNSHSLSFKNVQKVVRSVLALFWDIQVKPRLRTRHSRNAITPVPAKHPKTS